MKREVLYFEKSGVENTAACVEVVRKILSALFTPNVNNAPFGPPNSGGINPAKSGLLSQTDYSSREDEINSMGLKEGYNHLVVATTSGETGLLFAREFSDGKRNVVIVTHSSGFRESNQQELTADLKEKIIKSGAKIYTGTILTHSIETGLAQKFGGSYPTLLIAQTLRRLGEGVKVCCEIVMEGCDAGLLPENESVIAVAGTGKGADTVCIIKSAASKRFLDLQVMEILAKPREW